MMFDLINSGAINVVPVIGGVNEKPQKTVLAKGKKKHIVIATPGRFLDHLQQGSIFLKPLGFFYFFIYFQVKEKLLIYSLTK
jgi:superfamily II DNA/RNA helicase